MRGNALCKESLENRIVKETKESRERQLVLAVGMKNSWFENIAYLLTYGEFLEGMTTR